MEALDGRPHFTAAERLEYCVLAPRDKATLDQFHSITSWIYCIVQLGYCKAHHLFFVFDLPDVEEDARYIQRPDFPAFQLDALDVTKGTRLRQQGVRVRRGNYRSGDTAQRQALAAKARQAAPGSAKPIEGVRARTQSMAEQRGVVAGYTCMQDTVSPALTYEQERLTTSTSQYLGPADVENLHRLLADAPGLYTIPQRKREPSDCSAGANERPRSLLRGRSFRIGPCGLLYKDGLSVPSCVVNHG